jgi:hypothetical protein
MAVSHTHERTTHFDHVRLQHQPVSLGAKRVTRAFSVPSDADVSATSRRAKHAVHQNDDRFSHGHPLIACGRGGAVCRHPGLYEDILFLKCNMALRKRIIYSRLRDGSCRRFSGPLHLRSNVIRQPIVGGELLRIRAASRFWRRSSGTAVISLAPPRVRESTANRRKRCR